MKSLLLVLFVSGSVFGQLSIIPQPAIVQPKRGEFVVRPNLRLWASVACSSERTFLETYWQEAGLPALTNTLKAKSADVVLLVDTTRREALGPEGYELIVSAKRISITGASKEGVFYGLQTLRQVLFTGTNLPVQAMRIRDKPRFGWRSFRLNEERNARGVVAVKQLLDALSLLKFNRLHWHLPNSPGSSYTQQQIQEITRYARERHITVMPEGGVPSENTSRTQPPLPKTIVHSRDGNPQKILDAANLGHDIVISTGAETDFSIPITELPLERVYRFEPIPEQMPEDLRPQILGVGYGYWGEETPTAENLFMRLAAAAEVAWTFAQNKDFARFKTGLIEFDKRWFSFP